MRLAAALAQARLRVTGFRARVFALALLAAAVPAALATWHFEREAAERLANAEARLIAEARAGARDLQATIAQARTLMRALATSPVIRAAEGEACGDLLHRIAATTPFPIQLSVLRADGTIGCAMNPRAVGVALGDRPHIRRALTTGEFTLSDLVRPRTRSDAAAIYANEPVLGPGGQVIAVISAGLDPAVLMAQLVERLDEERRLGIVDGDAVLLARHPPLPNAVGRRFPDSAVIGAALRDGEGYARGTGLTGVPAVFGFAPFGPSGARVLVGQDEARILEPVERARRASYMALLASGGVVLLVGLLGGEVLLLRPLQAMGRTVGRLAAGDLAARPQLGQHSAPELQAFAAEVSAMLDRLAAKEVELRAARDAADRASAAKTWFLGAASHELRTPLNGVLGWSQALLVDPRLPGELKEPVETIRGASQHLATIVARLLDVARIEAGRLGEPELVAADPQAIAAEALALVQPAVGEKPLALSVDPMPPLPATVRIEATRVRQILLNFLNNAVQFTPAGEVRVRVAFLWPEPGSAAPGTLRYEVVDSGPGVAEAVRPKLFQDFVHLDAAGSGTGIGLGLSISARIAAHLGGRVGHAERRDRKPGAVFWVEVPAAAG